MGKSVTILIPADRHDEEPKILERLRRGESVDHFETIRQRKDGSLIDISLTVSPIKNEKGEIIAASKIARNITESKRAQARQELLLREMDHRVKNLFALSISVLSLSGRSANSVPQLVESAGARLSALARAHALTLSHGPANAPRSTKQTTLHSLLQAIIVASPRRGRKSPAFDRWLRYGDFGAGALEPRTAAARIRDKFREIWRAFRDCRAGPNSLRCSFWNRRH